MRDLLVFFRRLRACNFAFSRFSLSCFSSSAAFLSALASRRSFRKGFNFKRRFGCNALWKRTSKSVGGCKSQYRCTQRENDLQFRVLLWSHLILVPPCCLPLRSDFVHTSREWVEQYINTKRYKILVSLHPIPPLLVRYFPILGHLRPSIRVDPPLSLVPF